jgi:hypothetical protein
MHGTCLILHLLHIQYSTYNDWSKPNFIKFERLYGKKNIKRCMIYHRRGAKRRFLQRCRAANDARKVARQLPAPKPTFTLATNLGSLAGKQIPLGRIGLPSSTPRIWIIVGYRPLCVEHHVVWSFHMHQKTLAISVHKSFRSIFSSPLMLHMGGVSTSGTQLSLL